MITVTSVAKSFVVRDRFEHRSRRIEALRGVSFSVRPGEIYGLIGPNGAGKTTTLRLVGGLMRPDRGSISVAGHDTARDPSRARAAVGFLTTELEVYARFTPRSYLTMFGRFHGIRPATAEHEAMKWLERLRIADLADIRMEGFSSGQRQKVSIARALLHTPPAIVFDEPTNGLDPVTSRTVIELLSELRAQRRAIIVSSHALPTIERLCDRVGLIFDGSLHGDAPVQDLLHAFSSPSLDDVFFSLATGKES